MVHPFSTLDRHFQLPHIRHVGANRPLLWLSRGWSDLRENLGASLPYGLAFAIAGYLLLSYATALPYLFTAAISGFFLIGPLAAAGFYEISRCHGQGQSVSFAQSLRGLRQHTDHLLYYGVFLAILLLGWERLSAILFALSYQGGSPDLGNFFRDVFLSGDYTQFVVAYLVIGGALAALVFALSAVAVPMLMDRDVDMVTAMMTSLRAVATNLSAMAVWAAVIVLLIAVGFATMMVGMVILLPLLGHASWHAYKDLIE
jgi:uncharacterized membrane protein